MMGFSFTVLLAIVVLVVVFLAVIAGVGFLLADEEARRYILMGCVALAAIVGLLACGLLVLLYVAGWPAF